MQLSMEKLLQEVMNELDKIELPMRIASADTLKLHKLAALKELNEENKKELDALLRKSQHVSLTRALYNTQKSVENSEKLAVEIKKILQKHFIKLNSVHDKKICHARAGGQPFLI